MSVLFRAFSSCSRYLIPVAKANNIERCAAALKEVPWSHLRQEDLVEVVQDALKWQENLGFQRVKGQMLMMAASDALGKQALGAFRAGSIHRALSGPLVEVEQK